MSRRLSREIALQVLYQIDVTHDQSELSAAITHWAEEFAVPDDSVKFARKLVEGTLEHREEIDQKLAQLSRGWSLERMATVDRNLLRLAAYEIIFCHDVPQKVSLNEAIELAKSFGGSDSAKFINGILDHLLEDAEK